MSILYTIAPNLERLGGELLKCLGQTLKMLFVSGTISFFLGLFFGVLLIVTRKGGILQNVVIYNVLDKAIDVIRSIPFIILMVLLIQPGNRGNRIRGDRVVCGPDCGHGSLFLAPDRICPGGSRRGAD